jgi:hypothetical protein
VVGFARFCRRAAAPSHLKPQNAPPAVDAGANSGDASGDTPVDAAQDGPIKARSE